MLVSLNRKTFEELIPLVATGPQYTYCWGKLPDLLKRVLISVSAVVSIWIVSLITGRGLGPLLFIAWTIAFFYWLWGPALIAYRRNTEYRQYSYSGFWRGEVSDVFITEELIGEEENVNSRGELVIIENRERRLNLEVSDETGFSTKLQVPLQRGHQRIASGQVAEMLVLSYQPDLSLINQVTDIYLPERNLWVSDYPYLRRDVFASISRRLRAEQDMTSRSRRPRRSNSRRSTNPRRSGGAIQRRRPPTPFR